MYARATTILNCRSSDYSGLFSIEKKVKYRHPSYQQYREYHKPRCSRDADILKSLPHRPVPPDELEPRAKKNCNRREKNQHQCHPIPKLLRTSSFFKIEVILHWTYADRTRSKKHSGPNRSHCKTDRIQPAKPVDKTRRN